MTKWTLKNDFFSFIHSFEISFFSFFNIYNNKCKFFLTWGNYNKITYFIPIKLLILIFLFPFLKNLTSGIFKEFVMNTIYFVKL